MSEPAIEAASRPAAKPTRFRKWLLGVIVVLVLLVAVCGWFDRTFLSPIRHDQAVEGLIRELAKKRPPNVTRGQWESAVGWTINLHVNSQLGFESDTPTIEAFEQRLRTRFAGNVDMETIDWIWSEYARLCPHGAKYQRFKEVMQDQIARTGPNDKPFGMNVP